MSLILSKDQKTVFDRLDWFLFHSESRELRIGGLAGTGKSFLLSQYIKSRFVWLLGRYSSFVVGALTGKAVERVNAALGAANTQKMARTLHKILFDVEAVEGLGSTTLNQESDDFYSRLRVVEKVDLPPLIFIDEASMVSKEYYDLLLDPSKGVRKVVFIGDHGQLPPITKHGKNFNLMEQPDVELTEIHRQLEGNPVIELAHSIREAGCVSQIQRIVNESSVRKISPEYAIIGSIEYATREHMSWNDIVHIVYKNKTRREVNQRFTCALESDLGAPVICLKNTELSNGEYVANGSRGTLQSSRQPVEGESNMDKVTVDFPHIDNLCKIKAPTDAWLNETYSRWFRDREVIPMDFAFAITCHKAQGSSWKTVVVWVRDAATYDFELYKRWVYTAITRAEDSVIFVI